jgi:hypothetical protein
MTISNVESNIVESNIVDPIAILASKAYDQAKSNDTLEDIAQHCINTISGFPENIPSESKDALVAGYRKRYSEKHPAKQYAVVNGQYLLIDDTNKLATSKGEKINIGVDYAFSYTQQVFGKLKGDNPALHALIGDIRGKTSTYASNRLGDLVKKAKELTNAGKTRQRSATKDFAQHLASVLDDLTTRCLNAKNRGDTSADLERLKSAKAAFNAKWLATK